MSCVWGNVTLVDIGAKDTNGSLREVAPANTRYIGVDLEAGKGVDIVLGDPYSLPFDDGSIDVAVSSSCFEHAQMFWLVFIEVLRILKPSGLFYVNAPSNGAFHRSPVDCWRFYPDCGTALVAWARRCGINAVLLESFISRQDCDIWNDFCAVFLKDAGCADLYPERITKRDSSFENAWISGNEEIINFAIFPEDIRRLRGWE
jgi:SAM-dependent methyltransferase